MLCRTPCTTCLVNSKIHIGIFYREKFHPSKTEGADLQQAFTEKAQLLQTIQRYFSLLLFIKSPLRGRKTCVVLLMLCISLSQNTIHILHITSHGSSAQFSTGIWSQRLYNYKVFQYKAAGHAIAALLFQVVCFTGQDKHNIILCMKQKLKKPGRPCSIVLTLHATIQPTSNFSQLHYIYSQILLHSTSAKQH